MLNPLGQELQSKVNLLFIPLFSFMYGVICKQNKTWNLVLNMPRQFTKTRQTMQGLVPERWGMFGLRLVTQIHGTPQGSYLVHP